MPTAVFVDAAFFLKRFKSVYQDRDCNDVRIVARTLCDAVLCHIMFPRKPSRDMESQILESKELYRIFVYDCPPLLKKTHSPISNKPIDFSKTETAQFRLAFHEQLKKLRKVALRLGQLDDGDGWQLKQTLPKPYFKKSGLLRI
jgi:hypothetical protein